MKQKKEAYRQLREMVRKLEQLMGILDESEKSCCGITIGQCHALVEIGRSCGISLDGLSKIMGLDNSTLSRTVNTLVAGTYVKREINPKNRRSVSIQLTQTGKKLFMEIETTMNHYFENIYNEIPIEKREQVLESFDLVLTAIQKTGCCEI